MLLVATSPAYDEAHPADNAIATKMIGVALAAVSSGGGEVTFLAMTHFYGPFSLAGWGSGTGAAGLVGAGAYALVTTGLGLSSRGTLFASAVLPFVMVGSFFLLLPLDTLKRNNRREESAQDLHYARDSGERTALIRDDAERGKGGEGEGEGEGEDALLRISSVSSLPSQKTVKQQQQQQWTITLRNNLRQMRHLFIP